MERIFRVKDDNKLLILNSDDIVERDGKFYVAMRSFVNTNFEDNSVPHINVEYKEVEEVELKFNVLVDGEEVARKVIELKNKED